MNWLSALERPHLPLSTVPYLNIHFSFRIVHYTVPFRDLTLLPVDLKWTNFNRLKALARVYFVTIDIHNQQVISSLRKRFPAYFDIPCLNTTQLNFQLNLNWANNLSMREYQNPLLNPRITPHYFR